MVPALSCSGFHPLAIKRLRDGRVSLSLSRLLQDSLDDLLLLRVFDESPRDGNKAVGRMPNELAFQELAMRADGGHPCLLKCLSDKGFDTSHSWAIEARERHSPYKWAALSEIPCLSNEVRSILSSRYRGGDDMGLTRPILLFFLEKLQISTTNFRNFSFNFKGRF